jgi:hypothetical protein
MWELEIKHWAAKSSSEESGSLRKFYLFKRKKQTEGREYIKKKDRNRRNRKGRKYTQKERKLR